MQRIVQALLGLMIALVILGILYVAAMSAQPRWRAVQLWTLWATDEASLPLRPLRRFTSFDACYAAGLRHGFTMGETASCLMYQIGDFDK